MACSVPREAIRTERQLHAIVLESWMVPIAARGRAQLLGGGGDVGWSSLRKSGEIHEYADEV